MKIEMTAAQAADILDDLRVLDSVWEATHALMEALTMLAGQQPPSIPSVVQQRRYEW